MADSNTTTTSLLRACASALAIIGATGAWLAQRELWPPAAVMEWRPVPGTLATTTLVQLTWALLLLGCSVAGYGLLRLILSAFGAPRTPASGPTDASWSAPLLVGATVTGCATLSILSVNSVAPLTFSVPALAGACLAGLTALVAQVQHPTSGTWPGPPRLRRLILLALLLPGVVLHLSLLLLATPDSSNPTGALVTVVLAARTAWFNYALLLSATAFLLWLGQAPARARHRRSARALWFMACPLLGLPLLHGPLYWALAQAAPHLARQETLLLDFLWEPPVFLCIVLGASVLAFCAGFFTSKPQGPSA
jgi:hypothetical protein